MTLKTFLDKYEDLAKELVRCGSCQNILLHSGEKYEIVKIGGQDGQEEGILCETCKRNKRNVEMVTRISTTEDNKNHVFQIPITQLNLQQEQEQEEEQEQQSESEESTISTEEE
jgi:hypothetical protein